jgi:hypothetical protein
MILVNSIIQLIKFFYHHQNKKLNLFLQKKKFKFMWTFLLNKSPCRCSFSNTNQFLLRKTKGSDSSKKHTCKWSRNPTTRFPQLRFISYYHLPRWEKIECSSHTLFLSLSFGFLRRRKNLRLGFRSSPMVQIV